MTGTDDTWKQAYIDAYLRANGRQVEIVTIGVGWYRVRGGADIYGLSYRRSQIEQMTQMLNRRRPIEQVTP